MISDDWLDLYDFLDNTQELLDLGFTEQAQELLDKYESVFFDCWEFHCIYSRMYMDLNEPRKAISSLIRGMRLDRDNVDCLIGLFYAYAMMGHVKRGGKFLLRADELYPNTEAVLTALIWYHTETNDLDAAVKCFENAQKINSNNSETYRNAGVTFDRLGRFEEAEACYKAALIISPGLEDVRDLYADHLIMTGKTSEAITLYEDALKESPRNIRHMSKLIYCLSQKGQFDAATELAELSIKLYPNSTLGYIDLAYIKLNTGNMDEAAEIAAKAISISPIDAEGYRIMAIAASERGDCDDAEHIFEKAISLDPDNPDIMRDYYSHLRIAGKYEPMLEMLNKVIKSEYPYCTEDYWFMADYYREHNQNVKSFRCLHLAYKSMPAERELLPPMIDIILERKHTTYSMPMFASYVKKSGWNNTMNGFMANKLFKDNRTQEGMRFLRFTGQRLPDFHKYIFKHYLYRYSIVYYTIIITALAFPVWALFGWTGAGLMAVIYAASLGVLKIIRVIKEKKLTGQKQNFSNP